VHEHVAGARTHAGGGLEVEDGGTHKQQETQHSVGTQSETTPEAGLE
jgi:hypothetical protein